MWLYGFYYEAFHVEFFLGPCSHVFSVLISIVIAWLGEGSMCFSCTCMFILHALFLSFSPLLGVGSWLPIVTVAFPGIFIEV